MKHNVSFAIIEGVIFCSTLYFAGNSTIASSSSDSSLALTSGRQSVGDNKPIGSSSPVRSSSLGRAEDEEEGLDSETENMLSPLADSLLRDDSKILDDNEIDEVLNEENFNIFSTGRTKHT